jgi:acetyl esterase/lipase
VTEDESVLTRPAPGPPATRPYGPGPDQVIDLWPGRLARPVVALLHGGFWRPAYDRTHLYPLANALDDAGWPVALVEFRRTPGRPRDTTDDVAAALDALSGTDFLLAGHSAGGHLALWAAASLRPAGLRGVLALAPVADLVLADELGLGRAAVRAFLGAEPATSPDLDPVRLPAPDVPTLLLQGTEDTTVPVSVADSYHRTHPGTGLTALAGTGHYAPIDPLSAAWPQVVAALSHLASG